MFENCKNCKKRKPYCHNQCKAYNDDLKRYNDRKTKIKKARNNELEADLARQLSVKRIVKSRHTKRI